MAGTYGRAQELYYHRHKAELKVKRAKYRKEYWQRYYLANKAKIAEKNRLYREKKKLSREALKTVGIPTDEK